MNLVSWNVNGIRAVLKKNALQPFLDAEQPDILCLQETKAKQEQVELELPGYRQFWYSADKPGYSGTAIFSRNEPLGTIFRWAQGVSHTRLALYGSAEQYPLYGARDSNALDYLGEHTADGGYRPISSCRAWRRQLSAGHYAYVVLTPAPTRSIPPAWTAQAPGATLVMNPAPDFYVYKLSAPPTAAGCS